MDRFGGRGGGQQQDKHTESRTSQQGQADMFRQLAMEHQDMLSPGMFDILCEQGALLQCSLTCVGEGERERECGRKKEKQRQRSVYCNRAQGKH